MYIIGETVFATVLPHEVKAEAGRISDASGHYTRWYSTEAPRLTEVAFVCWQAQLTASLRDAADGCGPRGGRKSTRGAQVSAGFAEQRHHWAIGKSLQTRNTIKCRDNSRWGKLLTTLTMRRTWYKGLLGLPWRLSGKESACQRRRCVWSLTWEGLTCCGTAQPVSYN